MLSPRSFDDVTGAMVVFGAATGLRPAELVALEQRDVDRADGVVYVRRQLGRAGLSRQSRDAAFAPCRCSRPRLRRSSGYQHLTDHCCSRRRRAATSTCTTSRARHRRPAQIALGIDPIRRPYDLRHTYATFALRAGISIFDLSRFMGASLAMIDKHYGHLACDGRDHAVACWTPPRTIPPRGRHVDVAAELPSPLGDSGCSLATH